MASDSSAKDPADLPAGEDLSEGDTSADGAGATAEGAGASGGTADVGGAAGLWRKHRLKLVLSVVIGGGLAWMLSQGGLPILPPRSALSEVDWWLAMAFVPVYGLGHVLRAVRWRHLLQPLGEVRLRTIFAVSWISFAIIVLAPLRSGEIARPYLIAKRTKIKGWEAAGTIAAERVIDGLTLSLMLFLALMWSTPLDPLPEKVGHLSIPVSAVPRAAYSALALFVGAFVVMGLFYWRRRFARAVTFGVLGLVSKRLATFFADAVERVANGLSFLPDRKRVVPFVGETLAYWALNVAGAWLVAEASGLTDFTAAHAAVAMGCVGIGILVPSGPGFFGAYQFSAFLALAMFYPEAELLAAGSVFVFLLYVMQVGFHLVAAVVGLFVGNLAEEPQPA